MEDRIRMDSHKLIYHPEATCKWLKGENIYPIEIEISPSGACNHRCIFCAVDYVGYQPAFLDKDTILQNIRQMHTKGLKSVICSGEGEPLLNKDMPEIANGGQMLLFKFVQNIQFKGLGCGDINRIPQKIRQSR